MTKSSSLQIDQSPSNDSTEMSTNQNQCRDGHEPTWEEIRPWAEFMCWTMLVMAPIINWFNGPAVSDDQYVVRTGLIVLAACGGIGFRLSAWFRR
jgi:hypothetical protein